MPRCVLQDARLPWPPPSHPTDSTHTTSDPGMQLYSLLAQRGASPVDFSGWQSIDAAEVSAGQSQGRVRDKITHVDRMLEVAAGA